MNSQEKGFSPVVGDSLLILLAIVAAVLFQSWFTLYNSGLQTNVEGQNSGAQEIILQELDKNGTLYFTHNFLENITVLAIRSNSVSCSIAGSYAPGSYTIALGDCLVDGENEVVLISNKGVEAKSFFN